jgi:hypothetical protein
MDNNNREHKKEYHEFINFATQGMSENAQFSIAIAVGIFGILAIFVSINDHHDQDMSKNALWLQKPSIKAIGVVLSIAYWALVLFGMQSYVTRRLFEGVMGDYMKKMNEEWYYNDIKDIAKENKLANWMVRVIWASNHERKDRHKGIYRVLFLYLSITFILWFFIVIL